jgi:hypothetical protein
MNLASLSWLKGESDSWKEMKIQHALAEYNFGDVDDAIGLDPGKNWGMGVIRNGVLRAYWGRLPDMEHDHDYFDVINDFILGWLPPKVPAKIVCVEGASFGEKFGQILLEDIRLSFLLAFKKRGFDVTLVPPKTARKIVLGSGNTKASELFVSINGNGADGACLALYGSGYKYKED